MSGESEITTLLAALRDGDRTAMDRLFPLVHREFRGRAHQQLARRRPGETLSTTALVHETYLKLAGSSRQSYEDRLHFFAVASRAMRQILVDYARRRVLGPDHPMTMATLNNLAIVRYRVGRLPAAEDAFREALDLWRPKLGPEHTYTLRSMSSLGAVFSEQGKFDEAEKLLREVIRVDRAAGDSTVDAGQPLRNLGILLRRTRCRRSLGRGGVTAGHELRDDGCGPLGDSSGGSMRRRSSCDARVAQEEAVMSRRFVPTFVVATLGRL